MTLSSIANIAINYRNMLIELMYLNISNPLSFELVEQPSVLVFLKYIIDLSSVTFIVVSFDFRLNDIRGD